MSDEQKRRRNPLARWCLAVGAAVSVMGLALAASPDGAEPVAAIGGVLLGLGVFWSN
ncbi:hypothetical protein [Cellulomonas gilvus]|uniref:Uncharacterized protein n=1 Tax=Cellulomonas gilvus (strain ATCC 13127 / NRRL B-14078) TaxID=593907 RepID=F8A2F5_CELGA|nr:hypothetical protein [Cellulomonas gilvus]AEI11812.1 hypothetical protein Celgi_1293 [Cellulomonas gilvus ATCC 13127]